MPYKKGSLAEQAGKQRRTAKRRIARLEKEINRSDSDSERLFFRQQIDVLREQIQKTYQRDPLTNKATGFDKDSVRMAVQNLTRQNVASALGTSNQQRKNFLTTQELNRAMSYNFIGPTQSEFTKEEVGIFYRATQEAWEGLPTSADRNRAILEYYGQTDLRAFVKEVLAQNKEAVKASQKEPSANYESPDDLPQQEDTSNRAPSDVWIDYVNKVNLDTLNSLKYKEDENSSDVM